MRVSPARPSWSAMRSRIREALDPQRLMARWGNSWGMVGQAR
jgi:hypothetical protein